MMLTINRDYFTSYCIMGRIVEPQSGRGWDCIERPWVPSSGWPAGVKGQSCIPLGEYRVSRYNSDAHPGVYALSSPALGVYVQPSDVPPSAAEYARTNVLIHPANWASELRGCVAPGKQRLRGKDGIWQVAQSRDAMNEIRNILSRAVEITLSITSGSVAPSSGGSVVA